MVNLQPNFDRFIDNISLGEPQTSRIDSAARTIQDFVCSQYGLPRSNTFIQGSYANGTAVEPVDDGEYDVDIVAVCVPDNSSADQALDDLEATFASSGNYRDRIVRKKPCVRLEYAEDDVGKFHVDVVPTRLTHLNSPPLDAPRRRIGWHGTAPREYTEWCRQQGDPFRRTVKVFKRWRDEQSSVRDSIKSIVLQVLVAHWMPKANDDQMRIAATFKGMYTELQNATSAPLITNPVLRDENLASAWTDESFRSFVDDLGDAVAVIDRALATENIKEAAEVWRGLLGEDFPIELPESQSLQLGDYSHALSPADRGWATSLDGRYGVTIRAWKKRKRLRQIDQDHTIFAGSKLKFKAQVSAPNHVEVWWQVANTGKHARDSSGLRGEIFKARNERDGESADQSENWENTAFTGVHLIRALAVRDRTVVAQSEWHRVKIWAPRHPFSL